MRGLLFQLCRHAQGEHTHTLLQITAQISRQECGTRWNTPTPTQTEESLVSNSKTLRKAIGVKRISWLRSRNVSELGWSPPSYTHETKMSTSDNHSHKEEKTDPSAVKKQSKMENKEEKESGNLEHDQLDTLFKTLSIKDRKEIRVKFLINVPVGVTPEMSNSPESHCQKFLDLLKSTAFREEDEFRKEDIAVVFGLNGQELDIVGTELLKNVEKKNGEILFETIAFTWKNMEADGEVPYQTIRETIKNNKVTKKLVGKFKDSDSEIYFCFFDADTVDFNHVLSSYIDLIINHNYPTVMSTGYVFPEDSKLRTKSERDRLVRIKTAEHFPLGTYYPEPNFCVRLPDGLDTLPESFESTRDNKNNMESPNLIRQVKKREGFSAVFADSDPIITPVPKKKQFHTNPRTWAISAYTHRELEITERCREEYIADRKNACGIYYFAISLLGSLLKSENEAQRIENDRYFRGAGVDQLFNAAKAVWEYLKNIQP